MMGMKIDGILQILQDSFDSNPDTSFNKGATDFLTLVEAAIARAEVENNKLLFENLVLQMLDLGMGERLPTTGAIADTLNKQGWNYEQVSSIWTPSQQVEAGSHSWTEQAIDMVGGRGTLNRIWHSLKSNHQTGFPKRPATLSLEHSGCKKRKVSKVAHTAHPSSASPSLESLENGSLCSPTVTNHDLKEVSLPVSAFPHRKIAVPGKSLLKNKITWWLRRQESPRPETPAKSEDLKSAVLSPQAPSSRSIPETPEVIMPTPPAPPSKRGRCRRRKTPKTPKTPTPGSIDPSLARDGSPRLHVPTPVRKIREAQNLSPVLSRRKTTPNQFSSRGRQPAEPCKTGNGSTSRDVSQQQE